MKGLTMRSRKKSKDILKQNENVTTPNLWNTVLRGKSIVIQAYLKKEVNLKQYNLAPK